MQFEIVEHQGWKRCARLRNPEMEMVVTLDVGPRVLHYALAGGRNVFRNFAGMMGRTGDPEWAIYGGHRLWHAPEHVVRTYAPDNAPVEHEWDGSTLTVRAETEAITGVQKEMRLTPDVNGTQVRVAHRLTNHSLWEIELAPWALSVMDKHARAILPQEPFVAHGDTFLPGRPLVLWPFTDMADPRWTWGTGYVQLRQDPERASPQKIGVHNTLGWAACLVNGALFVKKMLPGTASEFPDMGSNMELFTNEDILEVETLGPLVRIPPGGQVEHVEHWGLFPCTVGACEAEITREVLPLVEQVSDVL